MAASAAFSLATIVAGYLLLGPWMREVAESAGLGGRAAAWLSGGLYALVWIVIAGPVFFALAGFTSSLFWDGLSREVERRLGIAPPKRGPGVAAQAFDTIVRLPFTLAIAFFSLVLGGIVAVPVVLVGWLSLYDFTAPASVRRGVLFPRQFRQAWRSEGAIGFALGCGLISLFPLINVLLMPALVAGGTALHAQRSQVVA